MLVLFRFPPGLGDGSKCGSGVVVRSRQPSRVEPSTSVLVRVDVCLLYVYRPRVCPFDGLLLYLWCSADSSSSSSSAG
ncbi:unnamed protein product [Heligmosomoides polygyrus]|uniref:Secreted protein n=1 Tax=Heligmosomoides polygyrus TaxID=6339 RepID=A0A183FJL8_HELPZ|nr:unnamed protein product [Heligmosomoides polygyrus]